jgi:hypothetical protein
MNEHQSARAFKEHHGREYIVGAIGAIAEYLSVKYGVSWLAWLAALLFLLAIVEYTRQWVSGRRWRYAVWVGVATVIIVGTYFITRERAHADSSKIEHTENPKSEGALVTPVPKLSAPENKLKSPPPVSHPHPIQRVDWHDKQNWRSFLRVGMTKAEVRQLFGEPENVGVDSEFEFWSYGSGEIIFSNGRLNSWHDPP